MVGIVLLFILLLSRRVASQSRETLWELLLRLYILITPLNLSTCKLNECSREWRLPVQGWVTVDGLASVLVDFLYVKRIVLIILRAIYQFHYCQICQPHKIKSFYF